MGRFVAYLDDETLAACIERLGDEEVLRVAFVMEGKQWLERIVALAGLERMRRMLRDADSRGLGQEARDLLDHLTTGRRRRLPLNVDAELSARACGRRSLYLALGGAHRLGQRDPGDTSQ